MASKAEVFVVCYKLSNIVNQANSQKMDVYINAAPICDSTEKTSNGPRLKSKYWI